MSLQWFLARFAVIALVSRAHAEQLDQQHDESDERFILESRLQSAKMELWSRGEFSLSGDDENNLLDAVNAMEHRVKLAPLKLGPVRQARRSTLLDHNNQCIEFDCLGGVETTRNWLDQLMKVRGGGDAAAGTDYNSRLDSKLSDLEKMYGPDFRRAIELNKKEHIADCESSCEKFYCADQSSTIEWNSDKHNTSFASLSFGATPPEDFAEDFGFPLDLIKVSEGDPLFSKEEAANVVATAEGEGVHLNEYQSGKYKLGGDWLLNLPKTREWFNRRLESTFFPLLTFLFPEIISSTSVLRAHSVSLLKYNSSHPRTDVHIDNGILAMTLAMTPESDYVGGGTFFEHMGVDNVLPMDVGHGTFRPGSVRHGGHRVTSGTRYILGAFLLLEDRVEHVRRLKNRGSELRRAGDLEDAAKHFEWAVGINPKCTTCLKDWAEILLTNKDYILAEEKIRKVLEYLEDRDSDALFTLGLILSEQGRDDESIEAYTKSVDLNAEDAELCYNLGIKLGGKGDTHGEMSMYARATSINPKMGGAWVNWGTTLAESGNIDDAEIMFLKAITIPEVAPKAKINLALVYQSKANALASQGELAGAKEAVNLASQHLDEAKPLLDAAVVAVTMGDANNDNAQYAAQFDTLRLQCHRLKGSILAGLKDFAACEEEFRIAADKYPKVPGVWEMLARVLDAQGKTQDAAKARKQMTSLGR